MSRSAARADGVLVVGGRHLQRAERLGRLLGLRGVQQPAPPRRRLGHDDGVGRADVAGPEHEAEARLARGRRALVGEVHRGAHQKLGEGGRPALVAGKLLGGQLAHVQQLLERDRLGLPAALLVDHAVHCERAGQPPLVERVERPGGDVREPQHHDREQGHDAPQQQLAGARPLALRTAVEDEQGPGGERHRADEGAEDRVGHAPQPAREPLGPRRGGGERPAAGDRRPPQGAPDLQHERQQRDGPADGGDEAEVGAALVARRPDAGRLGDRARLGAPAQHVAGEHDQLGEDERHEGDEGARRHQQRRHPPQRVAQRPPGLEHPHPQREHDPGEGDAPGGERPGTEAGEADLLVAPGRPGRVGRQPGGAVARHPQAGLPPGVEPAERAGDGPQQRGEEDEVGEQADGRHRGQPHRVGHAVGQVRAVVADPALLGRTGRERALALEGLRRAVAAGDRVRRRDERPAGDGRQVVGAPQHARLVERLERTEVVRRRADAAARAADADAGLTHRCHRAR